MHKVDGAAKFARERRRESDGNVELLGLSEGQNESSDGEDTLNDAHKNSLLTNGD